MEFNFPPKDWNKINLFIRHPERKSRDPSMRLRLVGMTKHHLFSTLNRGPTIWIFAGAR